MSGQKICTIGTGSLGFFTYAVARSETGREYVSLFIRARSSCLVLNAKGLNNAQIPRYDRTYSTPRDTIRNQARGCDRKSHREARGETPWRSARRSNVNSRPRPTVCQYDPELERNTYIPLSRSKTPRNTSELFSVFYLFESPPLANIETSDVLYTYVEQNNAFHFRRCRMKR